MQGQLVDQPRRQIGVDRRRSAGDRDVALTCRAAGLVERGLDAVGDEVERRPAVHGQRLARIVGQHEDRRVIRRGGSPPPPPPPGPPPPGGGRQIWPPPENGRGRHRPPPPRGGGPPPPPPPR